MNVTHVEILLQDGSSLYEIHIFVSVSTLVGFLFCIAAFIQYYEVVFFGEYQLLLRWAKCLCPFCLAVGH